MYGADKDNSNETLQVFWLDGTKKYVEDATWILAVSIISIILVFLVPLLIILYRPFVYLYTNERRAIPNKISHFYDSARLCYKDNYIAYWFTAMYLFYRIGALAIYAFTTTIHYQYVWQCGFFLIMLLIHCIVQLYRKRIYNIIDGIIFMNMTLISLISLYRLYAADLGLFETGRSFWYQLLLIYLPFVYIVLLWPCVRSYKYIKAKQLKKELNNKYIVKLIRFVDGNLLYENARQYNEIGNDEQDGMQLQDVQTTSHATNVFHATIETSLLIDPNGANLK